MGQRIAYGTAAILAVVSLFLADVQLGKEATVSVDPVLLGDITWRATAFGHLLRRGSMIPLMVFVACVAAAVELVRFLREKGARPFHRFAYAMVVVTLAVPWLSAAGWLGHGVAEVEGLLWSLASIVLLVIGTGVLMVLRRDTEDALRDVAATWLIVLYVGFLPSFALHLRCSANVPDVQGAWLLLITVLVCKSSDIGAYFAGSAIGRHKLIPEVSPGKSVEGMFGGLIGSVAVAVGFVLAYRWSIGRIEVGGGPQGVVRLVRDMTEAFAMKSSIGGPTPLVRAALFGLAMSVSGQFGDLIESCFKRDAQIKDSAKIIPRFGGILDLIDSPVFSVPVAWLLLTIVWKVV